MDRLHQLVPVAFVRTVGGRVRLLLAVDREGVRLFDGEPALLAEHRPGAPPQQLLLDGPERMPLPAVEQVLAVARHQLAQLVELAVDEQGRFDGQRLLGRTIEVALPPSTFDV